MSEPAPAIDRDALRAALEQDVNGGVTRLAELTSRHANDRALVYRAILLKRELTRAREPSGQQAAVAFQLLDEFVADQASVGRRGAQSRESQVEAARAQTMAVAIPRATVVECEQLQKTFTGGRFALQDVSLSVRYGEIVGVVGLNGNGKTTLFRLIVGELDRDGGSVRFPAILGERPIKWGTVRRQLAYVPQDLPAWHGSLRSNLHYEAAMHGVSAADNEREVDFIVERLGLRNELGKRWHQLSGGFRLRFALARALVWKPKLLVLDEPLANLDFLTLQLVLKDLRNLTDSLRFPLGVLVSSQHLHEIEEVSDKLLLLDAGRARFFGAVAAIGSDRVVNRFELAGDFEIQDLQAVLSGPGYHSIYYSGVAFVVTAATELSAHDVLRSVTDAKLAVSYFRDISRSAKGLLHDGGRPERA